MSEFAPVDLTNEQPDVLHPSKKDKRIAELEAEVDRLREALSWIHDACGDANVCRCGKPTGIPALKGHARRALEEQP